MHTYTICGLPMFGVLELLFTGVSTLSASCSITDITVLPTMVLGCVVCVKYT